MIFLSPSNIMSYITLIHRYEFSYSSGIRIIATFLSLFKVNKNKEQYTLVNINFSIYIPTLHPEQNGKRFQQKYVHF